MWDSQMPSEDILNGVRHIAAWDHWFSAKVGKELGDEKRRSYLGDKLRSIKKSTSLTRNLEECGVENTSSPM